MGQGRTNGVGCAETTRLLPTDASEGRDQQMDSARVIKDVPAHSQVLQTMVELERRMAEVGVRVSGGRERTVSSPPLWVEASRIRLASDSHTRVDSESIRSEQKHTVEVDESR